MSYSFNVRGAGKIAALAAVATALSKVVEDQPIHEADRMHAEAAVEAFIGLINEPAENEELSVSVSGSVSKPWIAGEAGDGLTAASVNISVSVLPKTA